MNETIYVVRCSECGYGTVRTSDFSNEEELEGIISDHEASHGRAGNRLVEMVRFEEQGTEFAYQNGKNVKKRLKMTYNFTVGKPSTGVLHASCNVETIYAGFQSNSPAPNMFHLSLMKIGNYVQLTGQDFNSEVIDLYRPGNPYFHRRLDACRPNQGIEVHIEYDGKNPDPTVYKKGFLFPFVFELMNGIEVEL